MIFWYCGLGVGHHSTWEVICMFHEDTCRAFNLSEDIFDIGEDIVMEEVNSEEHNEETAPDMVTEEGWDNEEEVGEDDKSDWDTDLGDESEEEEEQTLDDGAEAELDDICDEDDNELTLEPDLGFSAL
ncbi:hypothetical protein IW261DRAFT_1423476 [Armillaria novae-zelandiae]|uniref:Uncharacterized protein n=1 Tax=Armillaria novae-zelandiae TaxID=153914 RepID=A0AA39NXA3_9AGAR|nr:hypothetical protein IW261DRAFT_1423476 [Armillaria novae-zelandiae]